MYQEENADGVNEEYLESLRGAFETACEDGNYKLCKAFIEDTRKLSPSSAKVLEEELLETPVMNFV